MTLLRKMRLRRGVPIVKLAFMVGMDDGTFSKAERGFKRFSERARKGIAEFLGTPMDSLFDALGYARQ